MLSLENWKKLRDYAAAKYARAYSRKHGSIRCPNCRRWSYEMRGTPSWTNQGPTDILHCADCGYDSKWTMGPGLMLLVGDDPAQQRGVV